MHILHVISSLDLGGAERLLVELAAAQARDGHTVQIVTLSGGDELRRAAESANVIVEKFEIRKGRLGSRLFQLCLVVGRVSRSRADIVHAWMYHAGVIAALAARGRGRVVLGIHHGDPRERTLGATRLVARLLGLLSRFVGAIVYVSPSVRRCHEAAGYDRTRGTVISPGVDSERFSPASKALRDEVRSHVDPAATPDDVVVVYLARYHADKDPATMVSAFARACRARGSMRLWMIGRGMEPDNTELERLISETGTAGAVVVLGAVADPARVIGAGDVIAISSRTESFGLALVEGMLCGLSPAATAVGVAPEILGTDRVAAVGDADSLSRALLLAAADRNGDRHRQAALGYSVESMERRFSELYAGLIG